MLHKTRKHAAHVLFGETTPGGGGEMGSVLYLKSPGRPNALWPPVFFLSWQHIWVFLWVSLYTHQKSFGYPQKRYTWTSSQLLTTSGHQEEPMSILFFCHLPVFLGAALVLLVLSRERPSPGFGNEPNRGCFLFFLPPGAVHFESILLRTSKYLESRVMVGVT